VPRPPKPIEHHRRVGRANGTKKANGSPINVLAVAPSLSVESKDLDPLSIMQRVIDEGAFWLAESDAMAVSMLREAIEERHDIRKRVMAGSGERRELRELDKQIISQLSALGFDPTARARLGVAEVTRVSKLADLQAKSKN
jgi:hypothetical protein